MNCTNLTEYNGSFNSSGLCDLLTNGQVYSLLNDSVLDTLFNGTEEDRLFKGSKLYRFFNGSDLGMFFKGSKLDRFFNDSGLPGLINDSVFGQAPMKRGEPCGNVWCALKTVCITLITILIILTNNLDIIVICFGFESLDAQDYFTLTLSFANLGVGTLITPF